MYTISLKRLPLKMTATSCLSKIPSSISMLRLSEICLNESYNLLKEHFKTKIKSIKVLP